MTFEDNIRKMKTFLNKEVEYKLPLYEVLELGVEVELNPLIGNIKRFETSVGL